MKMNLFYFLMVSFVSLVTFASMAAFQQKKIYTNSSATAQRVYSDSASRQFIPPPQPSQRIYSDSGNSVVKDTKTGVKYTTVSNAELRISKIQRPLDYEVIPIGRSDFQATLVADRAGDVQFVIKNGAETLQSGSVSLAATTASVKITLNSAVKNHRGDFLVLKIGDIEKKIGIGYSFVVAGQSNTVDAQCSECLTKNIRYPLNSKVVYLRDKSEAINIDQSGDFPQLSSMNSDNFKFEPLPDSSTFIHGAGLNVWNRVGKNLSEHYNVPVAFIIIGKGGTTSEQWKSTLVNRFQLAQGFDFTGVLWHQGESDAIEAQTQNRYVNNIKSLMAAVKTSFKVESSWVFAQTTHCVDAAGNGSTAQNENIILSAQREIINNAKALGISQKVFAGPNTNLIPHDCHFDKETEFNALVESWTQNIKTNGILTDELPTVLPSGDVIGHLESVTLSNRQIAIKGWACVKGLEDSIAVHVYAEGPAGAGRMVTVGTANLNRESAVARACGTTGLAHGFSIVLNQEQSSRVSGQKIYVHGIAREVGKSNLLLANSGQLAPTVEVPANVTPAISEGLFTIGGIHIYYSNGSAYCYFPTMELYTLRTGKTNISGVRNFTSIPSIMRNDGNCQ